MNRREVKRAPVLRFKGFTNDWEQHTLGDFGSVAMNKRIFKNQTTDKGDVPFFKISTFGKKADSFISNNLFEKYKEKYPYPQKGDLLISASGSIGRIVEYKGQKAYYQDSNIVWLNHNKELLNIYLKAYYQIIHWHGIEGSTIKRLYNKNILATSIFVPDKKEQYELGKLIKKAEKIISLQQRKLELLKLFKIGMLQNILADTKAASKLKFNGSNQEWRPRRLNSITNIITKGTTPHFKQASNGVNFIKIEDISKDNGKIYPRSFITEKENNGYLKRSQLKAGDLLFSIAGTLGRVGKVTDDILPANTNQALAIIRLKPSQNIDFCKIMLESDSVKRYIHANPTMGAQPNLSLKQISDLTLFFPDIKEQTLISQLIKKIDNLLALQYQNISKFKQLKQFLLQNIFI